ncbi:hypothetical protein BSL78_23401 [Apostichopus japonicus]|uniref:Uncharacterized protein n=1 Tax=Stichopus japonicus TaxID=307972 RepID=A0A2G8JVL5_STIJA|nr:hypothetical protein BSL78_23401 [Apostichopus japonicus]
MSGTKCLLFWTEDQTMSIENITAIADISKRTVGACTIAKWAGKKNYNAKVLMISENLGELRQKQRAISKGLRESQLSAVDQLTKETPQCPVQKKDGRKVASKANLNEALEAQRKTFREAIASTSKDCTQCGQKTEENRKLKEQLDEAKGELLLMQDERDEQSVRVKDMMDMHQKEVHDLNVKHEKELAAAKRKYLDREGCNLAASPSSSIFSVELTPKKVKLLGDIASMAQKSFNSSSPVQKEASLESCSPVERTLEVDVSPQRATTSPTTSHLLQVHLLKFISWTLCRSQARR